jgi:hypothetical protein
MITDYETLEAARAVQGGDLQIIYQPGQLAIYRVRTGEDAPTIEPPTTLDARRFWTTALDLGYKPAIDAMLAQMPERDQIIAQRETNFDRTSPLFAGFAAALGVTNDEVLEFFAYGAALP